MILLKSNTDTISIVAQALIENKVVIIPTDTVYGFSGIVPFSDSTIRTIKGREEVKPFIQLIASPDDIQKYSSTKLPPEVAKYMPGPLTVIVENNDKNGTTAFRCPDDIWLQTLIRTCNAPLYSTSTNRSGLPIISDIQEMEKEFGNEVFCIVDGEIPTANQSLPSTIVDISKGEITVVRQGSVVLDN